MENEICEGQGLPQKLDLKPPDYKNFENLERLSKSFQTFFFEYF